MFGASLWELRGEVLVKRRWKELRSFASSFSPGFLLGQTPLFRLASVFWVCWGIQEHFTWNSRQLDSKPLTVCDTQLQNSSCSPTWWLFSKDPPIQLFLKKKNDSARNCSPQVGLFLFSLGREVVTPFLVGGVRLEWPMEEVFLSFSWASQTTVQERFEFPFLGRVPIAG